jgi:hypothetical protein
MPKAKHRNNIVTLSMQVQRLECCRYLYLVRGGVYGSAFTLVAPYARAGPLQFASDGCSVKLAAR